MPENKIKQKCFENNLTFIGYCNSLNQYVNNKTKLHIKCNACGFEWKTTSYDKFVIRNSMCPKCNHKIRLTKEEIIERVENKCKELNYTFLNFVNNDKISLSSKLNLECNKCGQIWNTTTVNNFLKNDRNSHKCGHKNPSRMTSSIKCKESVINTINEIIKDTSLEFISIKEPYNGVKKCIIILKCKICNEIIEYTYHTLKYSKTKIKCKNCEFNGKTKHFEAINNVHEKCKILNYTFLGFDTSNGLYNGKNTKLILRCNKCEYEWKTTTYISFMNKALKCKNCLNSWQLEKEVESILIKHNIFFEKQKKFEWLKYKMPLSLDFFLPKYNIFIECQGRQHFTPVFAFGSENGFIETQKRDVQKYKKCKEHGIIPIYYSKVKNWEKFLGEDIITNEEELIKKIHKNG